jgi:hypothetical protein
VEARGIEPDQAVQARDGRFSGRTVGGQRRQRPAQPFFADFGSFPLHKSAHQMKVTSSFPMIMLKWWQIIASVVHGQHSQHESRIAQVAICSA